jgi:(2R)-3-sulfolactate dehydrogenase (NADP+)
VKLAADAARSMVAGLLDAAGAAPDEAAIVARSLVAAELAGHAGHGLSRLPGYVGRLRAGGTVPGPWGPIKRGGPIEAYDGRGGLGHVHLELATARARELAAEGLVAVLLTNAPAVLAPPGGKRPVLGTNPIALAAPRPDGPAIVCDLATAQVSRGHIMRAAQEGRPIPRGWAKDAAGNPTDDAKAALVGTLMPLGGPKGFALALLVEILTGALLGPAVGPEIADFFSDHDRPQDISHLVIAFDPKAFGDPAGFSERMGRLAAAVQHAGDTGETRLPGERAVTHEAAAGGTLEIGDGLAARLEALAAELGEPTIVSRS